MRIKRPTVLSEFEMHSRLFTKLKADGLDVFGEVYSTGLTGYRGNHIFDLVVFHGEQVVCIVEVKRLGGRWGQGQKERYLQLQYPLIFFSSSRDSDFEFVSKLIREGKLGRYTEVVEASEDASISGEDAARAAQTYFEFIGGHGLPPEHWTGEFHTLLKKYPELLQVLAYLRVDEFWGDGRPARQNALRKMSGDSLRNLRLLLGKGHTSPRTLLGAYRSYREAARD
jgi:hypothetical protein